VVSFPEKTTTGTSMDWNRLLSTTRVEGLFGQTSSVPIAGDLRSEFDRDYGRTVLSTPVCRLQDKAQVFPLERHDAVRTSCRCQQPRSAGVGRQYLPLAKYLLRHATKRAGLKFREIEDIVGDPLPKPASFQ